MAQIISSFAEMRNYAKKVDEGIEDLENRVRNPHTLSFLSTQSACIAESTLDSVYKGLITMKEDVERNILEERADAEDSREICQEVEEFIKELGKDLSDTEAKLIPFGLIPFCKEDSDENNSVANSASVNGCSRKIETTGFLEESPVFSSPNYNSTPDSASCRRNDEVQLVYEREFVTPKLKQRTERSLRQNKNLHGVPHSTKSNISINPNYTSLRNYTPLPIFPSSCIKQSLNVHTPNETMLFSRYKSRNNY